VTSNLNDFTSAESCSAKCFWEVNCLFWSWNSETLVCALKSSDSGRVSNAAVTSGQTPCDVSPECGDVFERNVGYHGNDLIIMWDVDNNDACRLLCGNDPVCSHWGFRADQNRCVLKTSDGGRRDNTNVDSGQRPCTTTTTTTTTPAPPLSCHECDQFVGCASPDDVGNVTTCPPTTSHCMVSVNEGTGTVFRRCGEAAETAEQCESTITLAGNIIRTCFCRSSLCNSENEPTTTTTTTTTTSPPLVLVPNGNEIVNSLIDFLGEVEANANNTVSPTESTAGLDTTTEFDDGRPWIPVDHDPTKKAPDDSSTTKVYIFLHYLLRTLGFLIIVAMFIILFNACGGNPGAGARVVPMHPPPPAEALYLPPNTAERDMWAQLSPVPAGAESA